MWNNWVTSIGFMFRETREGWLRIWSQMVIRSRCPMSWKLCVALRASTGKVCHRSFHKPKADRLRDCTWSAATGKEVSQLAADQWPVSAPATCWPSPPPLSAYSNPLHYGLVAAGQIKSSPLYRGEDLSNRNWHSHSCPPVWYIQ